MTVGAKMDVFLENFQRAWPPPPPRPFLEITLCLFPDNPLSMRKFAMKFFGLAMTPPPLPPFWKLHCAFPPKIYRFETNKICNVIFWIGNDPPPPFEDFLKKTSIFEPTVVPAASSEVLQLNWVIVQCTSIVVLSTDRKQQHQLSS